MRYLSLFLTLCVLSFALIVPAYAASPEQSPVTVFDEFGNIVYSDEITTQAEFLYKPFENYTVTEGFLLLFLIIGFCIIVWKLVRGV